MLLAKVKAKRDVLGFSCVKGTRKGEWEKNYCQFSSRLCRVSEDYSLWVLVEPGKVLTYITDFTVKPSTFSQWNSHTNWESRTVGTSRHVGSLFPAKQTHLHYQSPLWPLSFPLTLGGQSTITSAFASQVLLGFFLETVSLLKNDYAYCVALP